MTRMTRVTTVKSSRDEAWEALLKHLKAGDLHSADHILHNNEIGMGLVNYMPFGRFPLIRHFRDDNLHEQFCFLFDRGASQNDKRGADRIDHIYFVGVVDQVQNMRFVIDYLGREASLNYIREKDNSGYSVAHYAAFDCALRACVVLLDMAPDLFEMRTDDDHDLLSLAEQRIELWGNKALAFIDGLKSWKAAQSARQALIDVTFTEKPNQKPSPRLTSIGRA